MSFARWKIGDTCWRPWRYSKSFGNKQAGDIGGWSKSVVIALRPKTEKMIVRSYGREYEHPSYELKTEYPR